MSRDLGFIATSALNYFFLSYNSEDYDRVGLLARKINDAEINLWYDHGLKYGDKWEQIICERIADSLGVVLFFTEGILIKEESYVEKEFAIAKKMGKPVYVVLVDEIKEDYWKKYVKKASFLVDIDKLQCGSDINYLIAELSKGKEKHTSKELKNNIDKGCSSPFVVDSDTLLNEKKFSAHEIAKKHVQLDYLTIDKERFPEALNVEGDADTWHLMISETADCCANLIIDDDIVGYMDFIPVTPEDYKLLQTRPFDDTYVAFYSYGGRFDIFVSMFSIDPNYSTPRNYILFIEWMIEKIISWRENDINIGKIEFSIYSKHQAKALENLGFRLLLTNELKGMLYEVNVRDLLENDIIKTKFINRGLEKYEYVLCTNKEDVVKMCKPITMSLHIKNGGILQFENALEESDEIIYARIGEKIVGYVCVKRYETLADGLYIEQIAVIKNHQRLGVGRRLLEEVLEYAKNRQYRNVYANCKKHNYASQRLFASLGFEEFHMSKDCYAGIGMPEESVEQNCAFKKPVHF